MVYLVDITKELNEVLNDYRNRGVNVEEVPSDLLQEVIMSGKVDCLKDFLEGKLAFMSDLEETEEEAVHEVTYTTEVYSDGFSLETKLKVDLDGDSDLGHMSVPVYVPIKGHLLDDGLVKALGGYEHKDAHIFIRALEKTKALLPKEEGATLTALVNLAYLAGWQECYRQWEEWEQKGYFHA